MSCERAGQEPFTLATTPPPQGHFEDRLKRDHAKIRQSSRSYQLQQPCFLMTIYCGSYWGEGQLRRSERRQPHVASMGHPYNMVL
jgi:hypothetical protein